MSGRRTNHRTGRAADGAVLVAAALLASAGCDRTTAAPGAAPPASGRPLHRPANFDPSLAGYLACSRSILAGSAVRVVDGRPGRMLATIDVDQWVKPSAGPDRVRLSLVDIAKDGVYHRWAQGTHLRLGVDVDPASLPDWQLSASVFDGLVKLAPTSSRLRCPYGPA